MRRRAILLWAAFAAILFLLFVACVALAWFILGPYGPPLPWRQTPAGGIAAQPTPRPTGTPTLPSSTAQRTPGSSTPAPSHLPTGGPTPGTSPTDTSSPTPATTPTPGDGSETARRLAAAVLPPRDMVALASRLLYGGAPLPRTATPDPRPYTVGRQDRFWLSDEDRQYEITATLRLISDHVYMYVQDGVSVDMRAVEEAVRGFEEDIYPTNRQIFGSEWLPGVDGDPHIFILNARLKDSSGYFYSLNEIPRQVNPYSNQHEMFCMNVDDLDIGSVYYMSTLAHEFQHMIHWSQDPRSEAWINEGMAQMAEQIQGYDAGTWVWTFLSDTDVQLTSWAGEWEDTGPHYGASYLWVRYLADRLGGPNVLGSLLDPDQDDFSAIEQALEKAGYTPVVHAPRLFDAFFADWAVANYINDRRVADGRYAYARRINLDGIWPGEWVYSLPWSTITTVQPYATDYIAVEAWEEGTLRIAFDGAETLPLVDTNAHSGSHFWYSNRGDLVDTTLTRAFDLRSVSKATLRYWLWYDIETDYDYAYVEVSTDGGTSWTILPTRYTTDSNPNGNNFGHGYTGTSGGRRNPTWIQEEIDLSAYAGRQILLRFEFISDDVYTASGLALDDVSIAEIGFSDDMESDQGWDAQGFVWVDNAVPLDFLVQLVVESPSGQITVQPLELDAGRQGVISLPGYGRQIDRVTLVVSAVAPVSIQPAAYQVQITLE